MESRNLDALIAEKVFGEDILRHPMFERGAQISPIDKTKPRRSIPYYSTKIADAWAVVEKLTAIGRGYFTLRWIPSMQCWQAIIDVTLPKDRTDGPHCPTAPEAICLAALAALGVEAPNGK